MSIEMVTLIAAFIAAATSIIGLFATRRTGKELVQLESALGKDKELDQARRGHYNEQLAEFYDPIYSLLSVNKRIFDAIGPCSSPRSSPSFPEEETAKVWNELADNVIVPNNTTICNIIQSKLHLLSADDQIEPYLEFSTHAHTYQTFREHPYEAYRLFQFPSGFLDHVEAQRNQLRHQHLVELELLQE